MKHTSPSAWLAGTRAWLTAHAWSQPWQPGALRHPSAGYAMAGLVSALAVGTTDLLEHALTTFSYHGLPGALGVLGVALLWGLGPAGLYTVLSAVLLNFVVEPPHVEALAGGAADGVAHLVNFLLSLGFGLFISILGSASEARRRELQSEQAARARLHVSEQQAHAAASAERDRLQHILEVLPEAVMFFDADSRVSSVNPAAEALFGARLAGKTRLQLQLNMEARLPDGTLVPVEQLPVMRALTKGETSHGVRLVVRNATTGEDVPILASCAPLRTSSGAIAGAVSVSQNVSALAVLEHQRDTMLSLVAHDLRNPLTSIQGMSYLLQQQVARLDDATRDRLTDGLAAIDRAARRMAAQITDLLAYARAQEGRLLEPALEATDIVAMLRGVLHEHQQATDQHCLELRCAEQAIVALVDRRLMERAVSNLVGNAIKYSPHGGPVTVSAAQSDGPDGPQLVITVADRGLGIPGADLAHVFEPYFRARNATDLSGIGLGLASVQHIIHSHGGTVRLVSTEALGTTVTLGLPVPQSAAQHAVMASEG